MKDFWVTDKGDVNRHKVRKANIVGHGLIHPDQEVHAFTNKGRIVTAHYDDIKVGTHFSTNVFFMKSLDELVERIDITTIGEKYGI